LDEDIILDEGLLRCPELNLQKSERENLQHFQQFQNKALHNFLIQTAQ
jgi:hypothetical protein